MSRKAKLKSGNDPPSGQPSGYQNRRDEKGGKRMLKAVLLFGGAGLGVVAATLWMIVSSDGQGGTAPPAQALAVVSMLLCLFASVVNCFVAVGKLYWFYRCPKCGQRLKLPSRYGPIRYPCDSCRILWDTGWEADIAD